MQSDQHLPGTEGAAKSTDYTPPPDVAGDSGASAYQPGTGRRLQWAAGAIAIVLLLAFLTVHLAKSHTEHLLARETAATATVVPTVEVVAATGATASGRLTLPGETAAWYESTIYARVNGYVGQWLVDIGDRVREGQTLALIETPELDAELVAAKAKLQAAESEVEVRKAEAAFAASTYARWRDSPKGVVSDQEREDKKAGNASATAELGAARAQVKLAQADIDRLTVFEQFKRVTAPYAGTITERRIDIGNLVNAGSSTSTTLLYRMTKDDPIRVFVDVPQSAATDLMKVGVPAQITAAGLSAQPLSGRVTRTSEAINPNARTFRVEIDLANPDRRLVPGLYVQVGFQLADNGLSQVPAAALAFRAGGPMIAVVGSDDTVRFHPVTIARDDGNTVELSSGVLTGERLVLNVNNQIVEGERVQVASAAGGSENVALRVP